MADPKTFTVKNMVQFKEKKCGKKKNVVFQGSAVPRASEFITFHPFIMSQHDSPSVLSLYIKEELC